ncbi:MAG: hypothetical protein JXR96_22505 [Deltaproteobacteria bacterium]|nr:hypothetical protein [Deltaproteobacteria bacterium]
MIIRYASSTLFLVLLASACGDGAPSSPEIAAFSATPSSVPAGEATEVTWEWTFVKALTPEPTCEIDGGVGTLKSGATTSITLAADTVFTLTCTNSAGSDSAQATVTAEAVAPEIAAFTATPSSVTAGVPTDVIWDWTYANNPAPEPSCEIDGGVGALVSGATSRVTLAADTVFILTCTNTAGSDSAQVTVTAADVAPEIVTFTATPSAVPTGAATVVTWEWTYANTPAPEPSCEIDGGVGALESGATTRVTLTADTVFTLTCTNAAGSDFAQVTVTTESIAPEIATFTATPSSVPMDEATVVTWEWTYANAPAPAPSCEIDGGVGALANGATTSVTLAADTVFSLTCTNAAGSDSAELTLRAVDTSLPWVLTIGGTGIDIPTGVAVDAQGNVVVTGYFEDEVDFGGGVRTSAGDWDVFVASYAPGGIFNWVHTFGASWRDIGEGVAVDESGNVFAAGYFNESADFGDGPVYSQGQDDAFVVSFTPDGTFRWARRLGSGGRDFSQGVAARAGRVAVIGEFEGTVDFGDAARSSSGAGDIFVALLTDTGVTAWSRAYGDTDRDIGFGVALDDAGRVYWTGYFSGTVDFGDGPISTDGAELPVVASLGVDGSYRWAYTYPTYAGEGLCAAALPSGDVAFGGWWYDTVTFDSSPISGQGGREGMLTRYDADGSLTWATTLSSPNWEQTFGVCLYPSGHVAITGELGGAVTFQGADDPVEGPIFIASWDDAGDHRWSRAYGELGDIEQGRSIACHATGAVTFVGEFRGSVDFGDGPIASAGNADIFIVTRDPGL